MKLAPKINARERILTFGVGGVGKSVGILSLARYCPDNRFYIIDCEPGNYDRFLDTSFEDVSKVGNVDVRPKFKWTGFLDEVEKIAENMERDDWLVIDPITPTWDWVQSWFVEQVHGGNIEDYFLEVRKAKENQRSKPDDEKKGFTPIVGAEGDWQVINQQYFRLYAAILNSPGHVYLAAEQTELVTKGLFQDDKATMSAFGTYGVKPKGQKRIGHVPSTVIWLRKTRVGEYDMTTIKDRGRSELEHEAIGDFAKDYFMRVAGWRPAR